MKKVGITGGIGSGKTLVSSIFRILGVPVYNSDERARNIIENNPDVRMAIINLFGNESYIDEKLNSKMIADSVFNDPSLLQSLNELVHPYVHRDFTAWTNQFHHYDYIMQEAAILFESGATKLLDDVIVVDAPEHIRIKRIEKRDALTHNQIKDRIKNQYPADKLRSLADYIIKNDDKRLILPQIIKIDRIIRNSC